ncbi:MAG: tRNA lysidine(34) synthetase TilS [Limosilactobacillus sp.]|uniref:tRNA lysidine(34) synthetase TilS n=1 Tax=Limosilactobacillus sp. TaxID=2773925 RepID=UPI002700EE85|nr:tRNA lysidine(34) synthetase TilS [Limosilactobacillus sp.]
MTTLYERFKRHLQGGRFFNHSATIIVAVSTGVDSMVLLHLLMSLPEEERPRIVVAHVNHELREQSTQEENFIRQFCEQHQLILEVAHWDGDEHPEVGVENAARRFRYQFFEQVMAKYQASVLVTAHHQNDLAETMLMKLVRGGQVTQLIGIADRRKFADGILVRPLLPFSKQELVEYAQEQGIKWYEDESNADLTIARNRYRHEIIPRLEKENPKLLDHLTEFHDQLTDVMDYQKLALDRQMAELVEGDRFQIDRWHKLSPLEQRLVFTHWLKMQVKDLKQSLVSEIIAVLNDRQTPQQKISLPEQKIFVKEYNDCFVQTNEKMSVKDQILSSSVVELGQWYLVNDQQKLRISLTADGFSEGDLLQEMWLSPDQFPLTIRPWQADDVIKLKDGGQQKVRRVLIDQKMPNEDRNRQMVLVDPKGTVVWLIGRKWSWFTRPEGFQTLWRKVIIGIHEDK